MNENSNVPTRKVAGAGLGGAIGILICAVIPGTESPEVAAAIATVCAFVVGYVVPE